jgi:signal transduction histidine kinase
LLFLSDSGRQMRLHVFINSNIDSILVDWLQFARTQPAAVGMSRTALRDHTGQILREIARDLGTPRTAAEESATSAVRSERAVGIDAMPDSDAVSAAETHGADRAESGFSIAEMIAEFRALRACVLQGWIKVRGPLDEDDLTDLMRFNEAVDEAVANSVSRFASDLDSAKDMFIAILTHDLRAPLQAVTLTTNLLLKADVEREKQTAALLRIQRSSWRMSGMIDELLDFTRARIGSGLSIIKVDTDVGLLIRDALDEARGAFPARAFEAKLSGDLSGQCDPARLKQVFANLLSNAAEYGDPSTAVVVEAQAKEGELVCRVANRGEVIPTDRMSAIFDPFKRGEQSGDDLGDSPHLGLGLYIAKQIVSGHGGRIDVQSTPEDGTVFTVVLPR